MGRDEGRKDEGGGGGGEGVEGGQREVREGSGVIVTPYQDHQWFLGTGA